MKIVYEDGDCIVRVVIQIDDRLAKSFKDEDIKNLVARCQFKAMKNVPNYIREELLIKLGKKKLKEMK